MQNKYITVFAITILGISVSIKLGNPLYYINQFKKGSDDNA